MATGFSFGAKTTATPTFGTGSITFGTPAAQPQQFGFGNLSSSAPNLFGTQTAPTTSLGYKIAGFGAPTTTQSGGFSFGAAAPSFGAPAATTGLGFGTPAATAAPTGLGFKSPANTGLNFGAPAASTGLSFGAPASTGLGFGAPASTGLSFATPASSGLSFGTSTTSAASGFGTTLTTPSTGLGFGATTAAPGTGLSFGAPATSASTLGVNFGTPSASSSGLSFASAATGSGFSFNTTSGLGGLGGSATGSTSLGLTVATTAPPNVGLGGVAFPSKSGNTPTTHKEPPIKEQPLPNELSQLVEQFKTVLQTEKNHSLDVSRSSVNEFCKIGSELEKLSQGLHVVENQLLNNRRLAEDLKLDSVKSLQNIEMAQRAGDIAPNLHYDSTVSLNYFLETAERFERDMQQLKSKIDNADKFLRRCNEPAIITSQDLAQGLKKLHDTFVALAGRMQSVHNEVETQKAIFLNLRRRILKDPPNPFEKVDKHVESINVIMSNALKATPPPNLASGPTPFNRIALGSNNMTIAAEPNQATQFQVAAPPTFSGFGTAPMFGTPTQNTLAPKPGGFMSTPFQLNTSSNFQLQKPPTGNKRGKQ